MRFDIVRDRTGEGWLFNALVVGSHNDLEPKTRRRRDLRRSNYPPGLTAGRVFAPFFRSLTLRSVMYPQTAALHMMCGKIAAGKSTLCAKLAQSENTVLLSEDSWLANLYPEIGSMADYITASERLRGVLTPHIVSLLRLKLSVVLDFQANTVTSRNWMRSLFLEARADHCLHFLDVPDDICRARLHARNASGTHEYAADDAVFDQVLAHFAAPDPTERFNVIHYRIEGAS
jgi:predicted kinase